MFSNVTADSKIEYKASSNDTEMLYGNSLELMFRDNESQWVSRYDKENVELIIEPVISTNGRYIHKIFIKFGLVPSNFDVEC